ncbi:phytoene synthase [Actinorhabdospora filicis]|uniref:Phytoene synthase n=1 Tax=Actinorhabdospora filicis TaxID=1785913 RepID=A0A9W6SQL4_9ACTN|nr:phytoene/squalene synthase family protein [Actinorhabdospora filicis]GLZ80190.1 phytoene synthase [Actinorhabdospora filicis]
MIAAPGPEAAPGAVAGPVAASYRHCRRLHREHGRTYYLATRLLPKRARPHVHALYGFARYVDDIVDTGPPTTPERRAEALSAWSARFLAGLRGVPTDDPILPALLDTVRRYGLPIAEFEAFLASMTADLTVTRYQTYADLRGYMAGSAAAIGTLMLPILGSADPAAAARPARELGYAFQLTNFIRDVGEDLDRGRVYLPLADLDAFGVTVEDLRARRVTPAIVALLEHEMARAETHYAAALPGIDLLDAGSRACVRVAYTLYRDILGAVRASGYRVLDRRARVPLRRRALVALRELSRR